MVTLHTTPVLSLPQIRERFDVVWCGGMPSDDTTTRGELLPREGREERNQITSPADRKAMESRTRGTVRMACGRHRIRPKPFVPPPDDPVVCRCGCGMAIPPRPRRKDGSLTAHGRSIRGYVRGHNAATSVVRGRAYVAPAAAAGQTTESEGGC